MHVAATDPAPTVVTREELTQAAVEDQRKLQKEALAVEGKPNDDAAVEKAMKGWYEESVLMEQPFVKDPSKTVKALIEEKIGTIKENITVARFARWSVGETVKAPAASE